MARNTSEGVTISGGVVSLGTLAATAAAGQDLGSSRPARGKRSS